MVLLPSTGGQFLLAVPFKLYSYKVAQVSLRIASKYILLYTYPVPLNIGELRITTNKK